MSDQQHILIVDDDNDFVEAMRIVLESTGYSFVTAVDSNEALQRLQEKRPDLIILDVIMHHRDEGFQLAYQLKNNSQWAAIPLLMISAIAQESGFKFSPESDEDFLPVDGFLEKPVKPNLLLEKVAALLNR